MEYSLFFINFPKPINKPRMVPMIILAIEKPIVNNVPFNSKGAYSTMISHLKSITIPPPACELISSLLTKNCVTAYMIEVTQFQKSIIVDLLMVVYQVQHQTTFYRFSHMFRCQ